LSPLSPLSPLSSPPLHQPEIDRVLTSNTRGGGNDDRSAVGHPESDSLPGRGLLRCRALLLRQVLSMLQQPLHRLRNGDLQQRANGA
jgi:hypothetical protein